MLSRKFIGVGIIALSCSGAAGAVVGIDTDWTKHDEATMFSLADTDSNGVLSASEYTTLHSLTVTILKEEKAAYLANPEIVTERIHHHHVHDHGWWAKTDTKPRFPWLVIVIVLATFSLALCCCVVGLVTQRLNKPPRVSTPTQAVQVATSGGTQTIEVTTKAFPTLASRGSSRDIQARDIKKLRKETPPVEMKRGRDSVPLINASPTNSDKNQKVVRRPAAFTRYDIGKTVRIKGDEAFIKGESLWEPLPVAWVGHGDGYAKHHDLEGTILTVEPERYGLITLTGGASFENPATSTGHPLHLHHQPSTRTSVRTTSLKEASSARPTPRSSLPGFNSAPPPGGTRASLPPGGSIPKNLPPPGGTRSSLPPTSSRPLTLTTFDSTKETLDDKMARKRSTNGV